MKRSKAPKGHGRLVDRTLSWITRDFPCLEAWRDLALQWLGKQEGRITKRTLQGLSLFLERFLVQQGLPTDPNIVMRKDTSLPDFFESACTQTHESVVYNNSVHRFLEFVIETHYSTIDPKTGLKIHDPAYHNPVALRHPNRLGKLHPLLRTPKATLRQIDQNLSWITRDFPGLEPWRELALLWLTKLSRPTGNILQSLSQFLDRFLVQLGLPTDPQIVLHKETILPDFFEVICPKSQQGAVRSNWIRTFLEFVLEERFSTLDPSTGLRVLDPAYRNPVLRRSTKTLEIIPDRPKGLNKLTDLNLTWVQEKYPQLEAWRLLAEAWIHGETLSIGVKLNALSIFLERYIVGEGLPLVPTKLLQRDIAIPSFFLACCSKSPGGIRSNNIIHDFLDYVLLKEYSQNDDYGRPVLLPAFWNPVPWIGYTGVTNRRAETNKVPLPYGYIARLRRILIGGSDFRDWNWAQGALGVTIGTGGPHAPDWFPVTFDQIDRNDPDCVWRVRRTKRGAEILEMWSPVRWVALAFKLLLPLRTFQVRMLDSGEGDTYRYDAGTWELNRSQLAQGRPGASIRQGFLYRSVEQDGTVTTQLRANTNKTADIGKSGKDKGHVFPWVLFGDPLDDVFHWAEKLRNWQEKYNPIDRLTSWTELDGTRLPQAKSAVQLAGYPDSAFLFRTREGSRAERHLPLPANTLDVCWFNLLLEFEERLAKAGEAHKNGARIRFVPPFEERHNNNQSSTYHPLHSLRVSLITALVLDGKVPPETMYKVIGHHSLLMTVYYVVHGEARIRLSLEEGAKRLEAGAAASCESFLLNTEFDELLRTAICVDPDGVRAAVAVAPGDRNPVGWMMMADGCCLMGGNTNPVDASSQIGGCHNGGPEILVNGGKGHGPVPGGPRNCIRCRWFISMPHHFYALVARLNNLFFEKADAQQLVQSLYQEMQVLENQKVDAEIAKVPFNRVHELQVLQRRYETAMTKLDVIIGNIFSCLNLISRCEVKLNHAANGVGLITVGGAMEVHHQIDSVNSELLVLAQVCEDLELYPDLPATPFAVLRRAQILDMALMNEGFKPLFLTMTPEQQKLNGNALIRELARRSNPEDPIRGRVNVVTLMDLKMNLVEHLGFGFAECMPPNLACEPMGSVRPISIKANGKNGRRNALHDKRSS